MKETSLFDSLPEEPQKPSGPVTCLGITFENDEARRTHFIEELRKKLQNPEFRKIEGFPIGSDKDILNLSDPPYYTASPNPWIADFIAEWEAWKGSDEGRGARGESEDANHSSLEGVWDFVRSHLKYLPVTKQQGALLQFVPERDPRILFDQMIAFYVRKGYPVPISSQEFQIGLAQRFIERDGMYFLPDQVAEYDRKKMTSGELKQMAMFVSDEASAIQWLRQLIKEKPQTFSDINPQFMQQLGGWSKNEAQLDLRELLNQNFLCYDGKGPVPEQIHAYLSTNWKELRNLPKDDPALVSKARDRWYVPDPNKAGDLQKLREKALLKEFEEYKEVKKKLKVFRLEAVRAGFKKAWQERDYAVIVAVADKIPNNVLEEDPKLLMWYDQAVTRMGGES